ncbi:Uncharacterised protein [Mycobacteroides abscessus subsp. abscessus]|nr:Uncharacterised protein [Mycobacteroides abscessus subsp. abscessus]
MHDHRTAVATGTAQSILHSVLIMTVNRTDIFQPQVGEHHLRRHRILHPDLEAVHQGRRCSAAAMLLRASQHMPPVMAPSPTTATTWRRRCPVSSNALASPSA